jgi:phosphatidylglycerol:prolipoprotein diacylglycerol transferase
MFPILFRWGPITLHTYGALAAAAFLLGAWIARSEARRRGVSPELIGDGLLVLLGAGILGARLLYVLFHISEYAAAPWDAFKIWQGGLVWFGGVLAAVPAGAWYFRRRGLSPLTAADLLAPAIALAHAVGRLGCFAAGCCYGRACDAPWAVTYRSPESLAPMGLPLHPSQLYETLLNLALFAGLRILGRRDSFRPGTGRSTGLYLIGYGVIRLLVEFTRADDRGPALVGLTATAWIATLLTLVGAALFRRASLRAA